MTDTDAKSQNNHAELETRDPELADRLPTLRRVLLVEDDKALRRYLEVTLKRAGYEVLAAADGLEAMKTALAVPVDVVITDAMMPNLSGHELCRFLRNSPQLAHIPIILLSALEKKEEESLADVFLAKPVTAEKLTKCVVNLLKS